MQYHLTDTGALRVQVSDEELSAFGVRFGGMNADDPTTRRLLRLVLRDAAAMIGFRAPHGVKVEALPLEGGCLLLFTPKDGAISLVGAPAEVWRFMGTDALLAWRRAGRVFWKKQPAAAMYRRQEAFFLILFAPALIPAGLRTLIAEFAEQVGVGDAAVAAVAEHGQPIAWLTDDESAPPEPPDRAP